MSFEALEVVMTDELKAILKEIVTDLEQRRIAVAARSGGLGTKSRTDAEIVAGANLEAYKKLRKRIDALK
jgi:molybdopterin synthase catalytic subunit